MNAEKTEAFLAWATPEFEVALRLMLHNEETIHAFDFVGDGEPWCFLIVMLPKKDLEAFEKHFARGSAPGSAIL